MVNRTEESEADDANTFQESLLDSNSYKGLSYGAPNINNGTSNDIEDDVPELETAEEKRMRKKSHYIVYLTIFIMSIGFSIVLTGVWPYLTQLDPSASKTFLGWVVAANPLGQMIAAPLLGWCGNKVGSNRGAFIATIAMFIAGNVLYALLPLFKENVKYIMVASRFIVGVSSANIAVCRSYIASSTKVKERTTAISITAAAQSMGFILGPSIQTGIALAFKKAREFSNPNDTLHDTTSIELLAENGFPWNLYSAVGWVACLMGLINLCLVMPCSFQEHFIAKKEANANSKALFGISNSSQVTMKPDYMVVSAVLYGFFIAQCVYTLLEALMVPMIMDLYAFPPERAVIIFGVALSLAAVLSIVMYIASGLLTKYIDERKMYLFFGYLPMTIAMLIHFPIGHHYPVINDCDRNMTAVINETFSSGIATNGSFLNIFLDVEMENLDTTTGTFFNNESLANCSSLGCPKSQEWCYYTPIIEKPQLIVGEYMAFFGFPMAFAFSTAIYSKVLGPQPQGFWMGLLTSIGSFARVLGPMVLINIYTHFGTRWTFGILFFVLLFTFVLLLSLYKRLVPMEAGHGKVEATHRRLPPTEETEPMNAKLEVNI